MTAAEKYRQELANQTATAKAWMEALQRAHEQNTREAWDEEHRARTAHAQQAEITRAAWAATRTPAA